MKSLFIAEKPSVAREFAAALHERMSSRSGFMESDNYIVTWCLGHLVTMSYPDRYDEALKKWTLETLPFLPDTFLYEIIPSSKEQFETVKSLLNREDVGTIFVCTDAGREGEYIYRLVAQEAKVSGKVQKRVWIDSQTEEEIRRGIREAKLLSEYDALASAAYLRAQEDYLMGINFSRVLSLKYAYGLQQYSGSSRYRPISAGRVMTCVLGMVVRREREIRDFVKQPFFKVQAAFSKDASGYSGEWRTVPGSLYEDSPYLYKDSGFTRRETAEELIRRLSAPESFGIVEKCEKKKETKNPPLLYNLAELQNDCSKYFRISPDQTLNVAQSLYEKKLTTYPRTDARVLSSAVAKEIEKNIRGLAAYEPMAPFAAEILANGSYRDIINTRYTNDKQVTDHYAMIPTGSGIQGIGKLNRLEEDVYRLICTRFLSIFYPAAVYEKLNVTTKVKTEAFVSSAKVLKSEGYLKVASGRGNEEPDKEEEGPAASMQALLELKKGDRVTVTGFEIKEGETQPPKRYTSGSMILAMENAGKLIEDEELRAQIRGSWIGTSATRAEILKKLVNIEYLKLAAKTQVITPTKIGEMVYEIVDASIRPLLNAELTASWEKGLSYVADGSVTREEYLEKLEDFVRRHTERVKGLNNQSALRQRFDSFMQYYETGRRKTGSAAGKSN
ncbi:MAG: type IA DNA topoisomerase [Lachnospiraceae bacterium]|nr:type IA DNA topoisomerase [Lachnospiraceae bacterium]